MNISFILQLFLMAPCVVSFAPIPAKSTTAIQTPSDNSDYTRKVTRLYFGIPTFGAGKDKENKKETDGGKSSDSNAPEKKIGLSGLVQLITAGMGSPFLGEFEGVDKETGKMMFSLEANNLVDENGNSKQTSMPYFESGWVDEADLEKERLRKEKGGWFKFDCKDMDQLPVSAEYTFDVYGAVL
eukprot:CAMPEP_0176498556 /NCGR_PEP_ID=MMETSP0200_2-20121128/12388_1 /TAXON_ID=947934 /ORGANISM="Chaetoceros sp., Strain GSL56" /LENGTH=183 /DNA_ID=CAMNT_0017896779 /DNA_START=33 /DNA_END=585 /DNA_ORIENTATION=-